MTILTFIIFIFSAQQSWGQVPSFSNITEAQLKTIVKEFAADFVHTSATPPTSLGEVFGVEAAVIVGVVESSGVEEISKQFDPDTEIKYLPHAWFLGGVSVPYGISIELNYMPEFDVSGLKASHTSVGLKWSVTDQFFKGLPFNWAVRTYYTTSELGFTQTLSNGTAPGSTTAEVSFKNTMIGLDNLIGFDAGVVEPYFGLGYVQTDGELKGTATTAVPGFSIFQSASESENHKEGSVRLIAGCQFNLPVVKFGLEYSNIFSVSRLSVKLGLAF